MLTQQQIQVDTRGRGAHELTSGVQSIVLQSGIKSGTCNVFIRHTSASLLICENADPAVLHDLETFMARLVPDGDPMFTHTAEGPDDMPAHVRSILTQSDLTMPIMDGRCALGTWQGIYLWEHRHRGHRRTVIVTVTGE
jgi:secondary thiamine-phosphate synthase enzyme